MRVLLCQITLQMHAVTLWLSLLMLSKCMLLLVLSGLHFSVSNERKKWCGVLSFGFEGFRFTFCDCGALPILFPTICSLCGLSGNRSITCLTVSIYKKLFRNSGLQLDNSASSLGDSGNYAYLPAWQESYPLKSIICSSLHSCATCNPATSIPSWRIFPALNVQAPLRPDPAAFRRSIPFTRTTTAPSSSFHFVENSNKRNRNKL